MSQTMKTIIKTIAYLCVFVLIPIASATVMMDTALSTKASASPAPIHVTYSQPCKVVHVERIGLNYSHSTWRSSTGRAIAFSPTEDSTAFTTITCALKSIGR